jgi:hypothetical protein
LVVVLPYSHANQAIKDLETAKQLYQQQGDTQNAQKVQKILNKL